MSSTYAWALGRLRYLELRQDMDPHEAWDTVIDESPLVAERKSYQDWEREFKRSIKMPMDLIRDDAKPEDILATLLTHERAARSIMDMATEDLTHYPGNSDKVNDWQKAVKVWESSYHRVQEQSDLVRRLELEVNQQPRWQKEWQDVANALREQYQGKGPQYDLLIESVTDIHIRLRRIRESERDAKSSEVYNWHSMLNNAIRRLQTYTESTKMETTNKMVDAAVTELLRVVESTIRPVNKELWAECANNLRDHRKRKVA